MWGSVLYNSPIRLHPVSEGTIVMSHLMCPCLISWLRVFQGFPSLVRQIAGNLGHICIWVSFIVIIQAIILELQMAMDSGINIAYGCHELNNNIRISVELCHKFDRFFI